MSQENMSLEEEAISNAYQYAYTLSNGKEGKLDRSNCIKVAQAEREGRTEVELELKGNFNHRTKVLVDLVVNTMKYPGGISTNFYSVSPPHLPAQHPSSCATLFRPILQGRVIPSTHCTIICFFTYIGKNKSLLLGGFVRTFCPSTASPFPPSSPAEYVLMVCSPAVLVFRPIDNVPLIFLSSFFLILQKSSQMNPPSDQPPFPAAILTASPPQIYGGSGRISSHGRGHGRGHGSDGGGVSSTKYAKASSSGASASAAKKAAKKTNPRKKKKEKKKNKAASAAAASLSSLPAPSSSSWISSSSSSSSSSPTSSLASSPPLPSSSATPADKSTSVARRKRAAAQVVQKKPMYSFEEACVGDQVRVRYTDHDAARRDERGGSPFKVDDLLTVIVEKKKGGGTFTKCANSVTVKFTTGGKHYDIQEGDFDDVVKLIARSKDNTTPRQLDLGSDSSPGWQRRRRVVQAADLDTASTLANFSAAAGNQPTVNPVGTTGHAGAASAPVRPQRIAPSADRTPGAANSATAAAANVDASRSTAAANAAAARPTPGSTDAVKVRAINAQQQQDTAAAAAAVRGPTLSATSTSAHSDADTEPDDQASGGDDDNDDDFSQRLDELSDGGWDGLQMDAVPATTPSSSSTAGTAASAAGAGGASAAARPVLPDSVGAGASLSANGANANAAVPAFTAKVELTISVEVLKTCAPNGAITRKARDGPLEIVTEQHMPAKHQVLHGCRVLKVEPDQEILGDFKFADLAPNTKVTLLKEVAADDTQEFEKDVELLGLDLSEYNLTFDRHVNVQSMAEMVEEAAKVVQRAEEAKQGHVAKHQARLPKIDMMIKHQHLFSSKVVDVMKEDKVLQCKKHKMVVQELDDSIAALAAVQKDLKVKKRKQRCRSMEILKSTVTHMNSSSVVEYKSRKGRVESLWTTKSTEMDVMIEQQHLFSSKVVDVMKDDKDLQCKKHKMVVQELDDSIATFEAKTTKLEKNYTSHFVDSDDDDVNQGGGGKRARTA